MSRILPFASVCLAAVVVLLWSSGCGEKEAGDEASAAKRAKGFATEAEVVVRENEIAYRDGENEPFTGAVVVRDKDWNPRYFAYYFEGKLHGPETRWYANGCIKRVFDFDHGEKTRHREWHENGHPRLDTMMREGVAFGRHVKYDDKGNETFVGSITENRQWDGHIKQIDPDGTVVWDADFDKGRYLRGIYPADKKQELIDEGLLKEDGTSTADD